MGRKNLGSDSKKQKRTEEQNPRVNLGSNSKKPKLAKEQNPLLLNKLPSTWKKSWTLVTSLDLDCPNDVHEMDSKLPMFPNLTSLALGAGFVGWEWLAQFLEKSPCLETLVFKKGYEINHDRGEYDDEDEDEEDEDDEGKYRPLLSHPPQKVPSVFKKGCQTKDEDEYDEEDDDDEEEEEDNKPLLSHQPQKVPSCLLSNLKVIKFENFQEDGGEMKMVEYFLKSAEVLEKLTIRIDGTVGTCFDMAGAGYAVAERLLEVATKLLMLPRASRTCQIEFVILRYDCW